MERGRNYATRAGKKLAMDALMAAAKAAARRGTASGDASMQRHLARIGSMSPLPKSKDFASKGPGKGTWTNTVNQRDKSSSKTTLGRKTTAAQTALKLTRSQLETVLLRWNGVKAFDTRGYYWMSNRINIAPRRDMPLYLFDLTAFSYNTVNAAPLVQLTQNTTTGQMTFDVRSCDQPQGALGAGSGVTTSLAVEKSPNGSVRNDPYSKTMLKSANIKLNCWGAKSKATQYTIQLVKFLDDDLVPSHDGVLADVGISDKRTDFYQDLVKPLTFNPISKTGGAFRNRMKVLRSETFIIQPNSADDGDTDPQTKTVSMFVMMNKIISYTESATILGADEGAIPATPSKLNDDSDYAVQGVNAFRPQTRPKNRIYLMIRASNYKLDAAETNVDTPSFDLMVRLNHQVTS